MGYKMDDNKLIADLIFSKIKKAEETEEENDILNAKPLKKNTKPAIVRGDAVISDAQSLKYNVPTAP